MTSHKPSRRSASASKGLLERAADAFGLHAAIDGRSAPPLDIPVQTMSPPSAMECPDVSVETPRARDWHGPIQPLDREGMADRGLLVPGAPVSGLGEELRIIKRELLTRMREDRTQDGSKDGWVIQVTSANAGEGKTFCAVNLALSMTAEAGVEVLLIDADLANPELPGLLGIHSQAGLMDVLADPTLAVETLVVRTDIPGLALLLAGRTGVYGADYLASGRMNAVLSALVRGRPERVLILDTPPLLAASAASTLADHADQTILVVRADSTTEAELREAAGLLGRAKRVSLLLNGVTFSASGRRFGAYHSAEA